MVSHLSFIKSLKFNQQRMRNSFLTLVLFLSSLVSQAQSSSILSLSEYLGMVKTHHPISKTAQLYVEMAKANVQSSRGAFDPKLFYESYQKDFDSKTYYDLLNAGFKVPTWFGIELSGGYEINQGLFLNPENTTTNSGLLMAGISLPLGKGLFIDERRAELKKAKLMLNMNEIERRVVLNELMYEASKAYWDWFESIEKLKVYQETLQLAQDRLRAIKSSVEFGDRPGIDTVEAGIQVQNWQLGVQEVSMEYENAKAKLAVYLWAEGLVPLELSDAIVPETFTSAEIQLNSGLLEQSLPLDSLVQAHPILQQYGFKIDAIKVEQRWKREQLKPDVRIKYNPLFEPVDDAFLPQYNVDNCY
jgi:outer membrane protein TolC